MLSIIIPTLNEEKYLPLLLESLKKQTLQPYEIIVADAGSKDATVTIAKNYGCRIVEGGLPAKARNNGARIAQYTTLFFIDADTILPEDFLKKSMTEFEKRSLTIASFQLALIPHAWQSTFFINLFYNYPILILEKWLPHAATGIIIKKEIFEKLHGFNEAITLAEDHDLARRVKKNLKEKCGIIHSTNLLVSDRRFRTDGWIATGIRYFLCELHITFIGPVTSNIFKYRFNHYNKKS